MRVQEALFAGASLATLAQNVAGFLITPAMKPPVAELSRSPPFQQAAAFEAKCQGCPFVREDTSEKVDVGDDITKMYLEFHTDGHDLLVNNYALFTMYSGSLAPAEHAPQALTDTVIILDNGEKSKAVHFGSVFVAQPGIDFPKSHGVDTDFRLFPVEFRVASVAGDLVKAQAIHLDLIVTEEGVHIGASRLLPFESDPVDLRGCSKSSNRSFCVLRAEIRERLGAMMEAARGRAQTAKEWIKIHGGPGNKARPCPGFKGRKGHVGHQTKGPGGMTWQRHGGQRFGHRHHRASRLAHWVMVITKTLIIPAALGVACGMTAAFVGMLVGRFVSFLWIRLFRGGRRGNVQHVRVVELEIEEGEKTGLMQADEDAPPAYQDEVIIVEETKENKQ